jgi:5-methylcytosine-specific restriction endonuclease McrA
VPKQQLRATVFVTPSGEAFLKARPLHSAETKRIFSRDGGICQRCGSRCRFGGRYTTPWDALRASAVDHIFPRSRGGQNTDDNLRLLCQTCNAQKGAKDI